MNDAMNEITIKLTGTGIINSFSSINFYRVYGSP